MKKKILVLSLVISLVAITALGVTLAYFTATRDVTNTFTMGNVDILLREPAWDGFDFDDEEIGTPDAQNPALGYNEAKPLLPGDTAAKDPQVKNVGSNPAYVRLKVTISNYEGFRAASEMYEGEEDIDIIGDVVIGLNTTDWIPAGDGVVVGDTITYTFNYNGILASGNATNPLFTGIALPSQLDKELAPLQESGFTIAVKAEAIQAENFANASAAFSALDGQTTPTLPPT